MLVIVFVTNFGPDFLPQNGTTPVTSGDNKAVPVCVCGSSRVSVFEQVDRFSGYFVGRYAVSILMSQFHIFRRCIIALRPQDLVKQ